nr:MAG: hypothetical protein KVP17_002505 [Porospora cf. gigantea B]
MGPQAGLDFVQNIIDNTLATRDQEHLPVILGSLPGDIPGRPEFLLGRQPVNPGVAMAEVVLRLEAAGATLCAVPCNTAHAPAIWKEQERVLKEKSSSVTMVHMLDEVVACLKKSLPATAKRIGILSTLGTYRSRVYHLVLEEASYTPVFPDIEMFETITQAITSKDFGIKAHSNPVKKEAVEGFLRAAQALADKGVDAIIMGCTEISYALKDKDFNGIPLLDPALILARRLIELVSPHQLKNDT